MDCNNTMEIIDRIAGSMICIGFSFLFVIIAVASTGNWKRNEWLKDDAVEQ